MSLLAELSYDEFEKEWIPASLDGNGYSFIDCRIMENILNNRGPVILQIFAACIWRMFDGKFGSINVYIKTKEELEKAEQFFKDSKYTLAAHILKDMKSNLIISIEDDYSELYETLA